MSTTESQRAQFAKREGTTPSSHLAMHDQMFSSEKIPCRVYRHAGEASKAVAAEIAALIRERSSQGRKCVLGLATGSTPVGVY